LPIFTHWISLSWSEAASMKTAFLLNGFNPMKSTGILVPSYNLFSDTTLKQECAEIQINMIKQKMVSGEFRADDHYNLGLALSAAGKMEEAGLHLETTVTIDPFHLEQAVFHLSKAPEIMPDDGVLINELARAQTRLKKIQ
jgi:hypothetical protein